MRSIKSISTLILICLGSHLEAQETKTPAATNTSTPAASPAAPEKKETIKAARPNAQQKATYPAAEEGGLDDSDLGEDDSDAPKPVKKKSAFSSNKNDKTNIDFEETLLEGKMKAPSGTFLQGRKEQRKDQMVQLRQHFRKELKRSRAGGRSLTD